LPDVGIDLLKRFFHSLLDSLSFFVQVLELSQVLHPGFFLRGGFQFFLNCLGDELAQGNPAFGGGGFCTSKQEVGNFEGCLQVPILPYLWVTFRPAGIIEKFQLTKIKIPTLSLQNRERQGWGTLQNF